jgi:hypothetical protein
LEPLKEYGYIKSYEKAAGVAGIKYIILRETDKNDQAKEAGSVNKGGRVGKK